MMIKVTCAQGGRAFLPPGTRAFDVGAVYVVYWSADGQRADQGRIVVMRPSLFGPVLRVSLRTATFPGL